MGETPKCGISILSGKLSIGSTGAAPAGDITDAHRELGEDLGRWRRISMRELSLDEGVFFLFFFKAS
jgi:hypothetical protein